ncbi:MAG TPA: phosphoenolpyruvate carboxylase [Caulobacteraceae bacterium]|nr:phosphoenolpyruvate carboxylase [Caulobacteraceae bacterium]
MTRALKEEGVALLEALLDEAIVEADGEAALALVRAVCAGERPVAALAAGEAEFVARALTCRSLLASIAEDAGGGRRASEDDPQNAADPLRSLQAALAAVKAGDGPPPRKALHGLDVSPVLTAHPTEVRRRAVVEREFEISRLLLERRHRLSGGQEKRLREDLYREIALLWRMRLHRPERIAVADEIRNALAIVRDSALPALADLYETWGRDLGHALPETPILRLGSWIGGDRDGHPGVDGETLRQALRSNARVILNHYSDEVRAMWFDLAISSDLTTVSEDLTRLAEMAVDISPHRRDEPYRQALEHIWERLSGTANRLAGGAYPARAEAYDHPSDFVADLETVSRSLSENGGERLVGHRLSTLIALARACGFHLLRLDLRQNADVHERVLTELFDRAATGVEYDVLPEARRVKVLQAELAHERPLRSPFAAYSPETAKELAILDAAAEAVRLYGRECLCAYVVSKTDSLSDMLEPLVLLKQVGLVSGGGEPRTQLPVSPLFETIDDLAHGPSIISAWLRLPETRTLLGRTPVQDVMLGYSDSNKDGGFVASRFAVAEAADKLAARCEDHHVGLRLFHGRGGSIGRGGGPAARAILAQPPGSVQGRLRITEQGEMIAHRFGDQAIARRSLESLVAAVVLATHKPEPVAPGARRHHAAQKALAAASLGVYRALVHDDPDFAGFFWSATPINEIAVLNIGSRPASRTAGRRIEDLRAIPWVFSWSQARFLLPGWYGFAGGAAKAGLTAAAIADLAGASDFFATLVSNMELALAQADMALAARYARLASDQAAARRIMAAVEAEHAAAVRLVLDARGGTRLLDHQGDLAETVARSARMIEPLNHLQLELLGRRRAGDESEDVLVAVELTIAGIAAGLRNTG